MTFNGANSGVSADAIRRALRPEQEDGANQQIASSERAALDVAELRALERAEFYGETPAVEPRPAPRRGWLSRLFGRRSR